MSTPFDTCDECGTPTMNLAGHMWAVHCVRLGEGHSLDEQECAYCERTFTPTNGDEQDYCSAHCASTATASSDALDGHRPNARGGDGADV